MKTFLMTLLMVFITVFPSYGEIQKPTEEQLNIWESNIKPFLIAFYSSDYETAWKIGKEAYKNHPHYIDSKKRFLSENSDNDNGSYDGKVVRERKVKELSLNRVDHASDGEYYYVMALYEVIVEDEKNMVSVSCERMEFVIFRVTDGHVFDRFAGLENRALQCKAGAVI